MTKKTTLPTIDEAIQAAEAADERVTSVRNAALAGDSTVKPGDIETAEAEARFALLRVEAIRAAESSRLERERVEAVAAIRAEIEASTDDPSDYLAAFRAVEAAAIAWFDLNDARAEQMRSWRKRLRELGVEETRDTSTTPVEPFGIAPLASELMKLDIKIDGGHVGSVDAERYLRELIAFPAGAIRDASRRNVDLPARLARELGYIPTRNLGAN